MNDKEALFNPIGEKVFKIRTQYVMLDRDLAGLYGVETKVLNQAVKRNFERFEGDDFMFQLSKNEMVELVTNCDRFNSIKHSTVFPYAFTDNGISMLSSVLNSSLAIRVNRQIIRYFNRLRKLQLNNDDFRKYVEAKFKLHEEKFKRSDISFEAVFSLLDSYKTKDDLSYKKAGQIGFKKNEDKKSSTNSKNKKVK
ncbi:MAG: hypothetical protein A2231_01615 [Candidatus Firestonebacteria bacterium RIFOXYA2_FULL_40_8]|nr:MAG: hypothetical protein A2231_01615 [Candidatus Firestonebacteria bacterium RIFOXYA2_FULL_40_8]